MTTSFTGQVALITGGTDGIGKETAIRLARFGAEVILVGRNPDKGQRAIEAIKSAAPNSQVAYWQYDLSLMRDVQALAEAVKAKVTRLDMLIHSAGVMLPRRKLTSEKLETVFAVQYLSRFYLTDLLLACFGEHPRIVSVSAGGTIPIRLDFDNLNGEKFYNGVYALIHESIANDLFGLRFIQRNPTIRFYNYGPFYVRSGLFKDMGPLFALATATVGRVVATTPQIAAGSIIQLLSGDQPSGMYSRHLKLITPSRYRMNAAIQDRLWETSEQMIANALK